ncbi:MAG: hypothetical protein ACOX2S_08430 [bacterium]|jgi:hypothetical protein
MRDFVRPTTPLILFILFVCGLLFMFMAPPVRVLAFNFAHGGDLLWYIRTGFHRSLLYFYDYNTGTTAEVAQLALIPDAPTLLVADPDSQDGVFLVNGSTLTRFSPHGSSGSLNLPLSHEEWIQQAAWENEHGKTSWYFLIRKGNAGRLVKGYFQEDRWVQTLVGVDGPYQHQDFWLTQLAGEESSGVWLQVYRATKFDPKPDNRPWLYAVTPTGFEPRWLGSRLSLPFKTLRPMAATDGPKLLAVENSGTESYLHLYGPHVFGPKSLARSPALPEIRTLQVIAQEIYVEVGEEIRAFRWDNGLLLEKRRWKIPRDALAWTFPPDPERSGLWLARRGVRKMEGDGMR